MATPYQIEHGLRTIYIEWVKPPTHVGGLALSAPVRNGDKVPQGCAYSKVIFGNDEYWETSPAVLGSAGRNSGVPGSGSDLNSHVLTRLLYHPQTYLTVVGAESRSKNAGITDANGTELHKYPVVG